MFNYTEHLFKSCLLSVCKQKRYFKKNNQQLKQIGNFGVVFRLIQILFVDSDFSTRSYEGKELNQTTTIIIIIMVLKCFKI